MPLLGSAAEPERGDISELRAARKELCSLAESTNHDAARPMLERFVVELAADSRKKTIQGILLDPRPLGVGSAAVPRRDGVFRARYVHVHAKCLGKDRFRVKTRAA